MPSPTKIPNNILDLLVAFDTETHLMQPGLLAPPLVLGSIATKEPGSERILSKDDTRKTFRELLEGPYHIGGANLVYDLGVMCADDASLVPLVFKALAEGRLHSSDILEALHDNSKGMMFKDPDTGKPFKRYALVKLEKRYLGIDRSEEKSDGWRLKYALLDGLPLDELPDAAIEYPRKDARGTFDVLAHQLTGADRANTQCEAAEMRAAWFLHLACIRGLRTDPTMVDHVTGEIVQQHEATRRRFFDEGIVTVRPIKKNKGEWEEHDDISVEWLQQAIIRMSRKKDAPYAASAVAAATAALKHLNNGKKLRFAVVTARLKELVSAAYQGAPPATAGGDVSTSRDTLVESGSELLEEYGEAGPNEKLYSTFVSVLRQGTKVPINPSANTLVKTQRTSYREPNLQQLPRSGGIRECCIARPGMLYNSGDYATLELCSLSQINYMLFGESAMGDFINGGVDLHTKLGGQFINLDYDAAFARVKAGDLMMANMRQIAKPVNFGISGLMGPPKLAFTARKDGVRFCELAGQCEDCSKNQRVTAYRKRTIAPTCVICLKLAEQYIEIFYSVYPEVRLFHNLTKKLADDARFKGIPLESFGDGMLRLEDQASAVSNHLFQNLAAQGAKHAAWKVSEEAYSNPRSVLYNNCFPVVFVHDEIVAEVREDVAHECAMRQSEVMEAGMKEYIPDVKIKVEPTLMRRWFKGAKPAYSKAGRLKPWWPKEWDWGPDLGKKALDMAA